MAEGGVGEGAWRGEAEGEGGEQRAGVTPEPHQGEGRPEVRTLQLEMAKCLNIKVYEILKNRKQLYSWFIIIKPFHNTFKLSSILLLG